MGYHGQSQGVNVHVIHRWLVTNETQRLAINTNPDNTPITSTSGLNCLCLQEDTGVYYRLSQINPMMWIAITGL
jgi:hypothetical protein